MVFIACILSPGVDTRTTWNNNVGEEQMLEMLVTYRISIKQKFSENTTLTIYVSCSEVTQRMCKCFHKVWTHLTMDSGCFHGV